MSLMDVPALAFTVQSPSTSPNDIITAIEGFITDFSTTIENMDEATFATHQQALISRVLEKDSQLSQRSNRYWYEIDRSNFQFDTREQLVAGIKETSLSELQQLYQNALIKQPRLLATVASSKTSKGMNRPKNYHPINEDALAELTEGYFKE